MSIVPIIFLDSFLSARALFTPYESMNVNYFFKLSGMEQSREKRP